MSTAVDAASPRRPRSLWKGFVAGAFGGLVGAAAKAAGEALYPPRTQGQIHASELVTHALYGMTTEAVRRVTRKLI